MKLLRYIVFMLFGLSCTDQDLDVGHKVDVRMYHHFLTVGEGEVYLMEDADEFPGWNTSAYTFGRKVDENGQAVFNDILPGTHYLLGLGFDGRDSVKGYQSIIVDARDPDQRQKVILYVTE